MAPGRRGAGLTGQTSETIISPATRESVLKSAAGPAPVGWDMNSSALTTVAPGWGLFTDLYELTMAQAYYQLGMAGTATFGLFIRQLPPSRGFLVAAGLEDVLDYLERLRFTAEDVDYLRSTGIFDDGFLDTLAGFRFTGSVRAIPEGRVFFPEEPALEVTGPIVEAQMAETFVINQVNFQSLLATKAARCVSVAKGRVVSDFSARRTHGAEAALKMARCGYIGGFQSTSNVLACRQYGIPPAGTMAHSFISSFHRELDAFSGYARSFPDRAVLLLDTYDTIAGAHNAVTAARELERAGHRLAGVRLDSGDLDGLSRKVRQVLNNAGLHYVKIVASGGLDEYAIDRLVSGGAPIDIFGVGTRVGVSGDAPWSDMAYKLMVYDGRPVMKLSPGKVSPPGAKQVFRSLTPGGKFAGDVVAQDGEAMPGAEPLLEPVMAEGRRLAPSPPLDVIRQTLADDLERLDGVYLDIYNPERYPAAFSSQLQALTERVRSTIGNAPDGPA